jgi:hypothetical protein
MFSRALLPAGCTAQNGADYLISRISTRDFPVVLINRSIFMVHDTCQWTFRTCIREMAADLFVDNQKKYVRRCSGLITVFRIFEETDSGAVF